jgi:prepilin-type N-terminal cleavage/methylation domain-containing protein
MISAPSRPDAGFTLVEVLVVLSVIGLMSALMLSMMGQFRHLSDADHRLTDQAAMKKTADHIAGLLERAEALPLDIKPDVPLFFMEASKSSARFLAVVKSGARTSGLFEIKIGLDERGGIKRLVETISPRRVAENGDGKVTFELLERAEGLTFSFLQKSEARGIKPVWRSDWSTAGELPAAVRVTLQAKDRSGNLTGASAIALLAR